MSVSDRSSAEMARPLAIAGIAGANIYMEATMKPNVTEKRIVGKGFIGKGFIGKGLVGAAGLATLLALGACGSTTSDRALSGGAIGAGAGAAGGALVGRPVEGAILGGAAGAGTGALTNKNQINLGKPWWR